VILLNVAVGVNHLDALDTLRWPPDEL